MHLLSSQTSAVNGQLVSSHLVQKTTPAAILAAEQVRLQHLPSIVAHGRDVTQS